MNKLWSTKFGSLSNPLPSTQFSWDRPDVLLDEAFVMSDQYIYWENNSTFHFWRLHVNINTFTQRMPAVRNTDCFAWSPSGRWNGEVREDCIKSSRRFTFLCSSFMSMWSDGRRHSLHCFVCKRAPGWTVYFRLGTTVLNSILPAWNDSVARASASAGNPAAK